MVSGGAVSLHGKLDYETRKSYTLCVIAEDSGSPPRMSTLNVTIYIINVYDDDLFFLKDTFEVIISKESKVNTSLLNLTISVPEANFSLKGKRIHLLPRTFSKFRNVFHS